MLSNPGLWRPEGARAALTGEKPQLKAVVLLARSAADGVVPATTPDC